MARQSKEAGRDAAAGDAAQARKPQASPEHSSTVGVYERPHPLRTRRVLVPTVIFGVVALGYGAWFYLH